MDTGELRRNLANIPPFDLLSLEIVALGEGHASVQLPARIAEDPSVALDQLAGQDRPRVSIDVSLTDETGTEVATLIAVSGMRRVS